MPTRSPAGEHQYDTAGGTRITAVLVDGYHPETTPRLLVPRDRKLGRYLRRMDHGATSNAENMDREAMWDVIQTWQARATSLRGLAELGVIDVTHLSPRQALLVSGLITQDAISYDRDLAADLGFTLAGVGNWLRNCEVDAWPAERFFSEPTGTCRHYADIMHAVYEVLKERQDPDSSQLVNSYMKLPVTDDHIWNALYTLQPSGEVMVTQFDATWNDTDEPGRLGNVDYTFGRDNVRDYWRQLALLEGTGKRPLRELRRRFVDQNGQMITARSMRRAGGLTALVRTFEALPQPLQLLALEEMDDGVRREVIDQRSARGLSTATVEPPQH